MRANLECMIAEEASIVEVEEDRERPGEDCIHPGVFALGPVPGVEHCWTCDRDVPRHLL